MVNLHYFGSLDGHTDLTITDPEIYNDRVSLKIIVQKWRAKYPFLEDWCLTTATHTRGGSNLTFGNINKNEFD